MSNSIRHSLEGDRFLVTVFGWKSDPLKFLAQKTHQVDCLIVEDTPELIPLVEVLSQSALVPLLLLTSSSSSPSREWETSGALVKVSSKQLDAIPQAVEAAIGQFLKLTAPDEDSFGKSSSQSLSLPSYQSLLRLQQQRLAEKLKERLGYLGVYYKRNPKNFLRHLPPAQRQELLDSIKHEYREIILNYFSDDAKSLNQKIDDLVNMAFFADVSVSQIVEIHMELMDEFSKHLKLEGRSEEILLDYRLTLIDTIAHLCEMYRRSIPRES